MSWPGEREKPIVHIKYHNTKAETELAAGNFDHAAVHAKMALVWATIYATSRGYAG